MDAGGQGSENDIKSSPTRIRDEKLNAYVQGLVCKLAGEDCGSIRVYVMEVPAFNAETLPNGAMMVWSGPAAALPRTRPSLPSVLGHEITHYLHRHSLERMRRVVSTSGFMAVFGIITAGAGVGLIGLAANAAAVGSLYAHTRDQERDADAGGFTAATAYGYDPGQAPAIWRYVAAETNANPHHEHAVFFATHPEPEERLVNMQKQAAAESAKRSEWATNNDAFHAAVEPFIARWTADELARGEPLEGVALFERLTANQPSRGLFRYALGRSYRKRNAKGDAALAAAAYRAALDCADAPPQAWRGLGLIAMKDGNKAAAKGRFHPVPRQGAGCRRQGDDRFLSDATIERCHETLPQNFDCRGPRVSGCGLRRRHACRSRQARRHGRSYRDAADQVEPVLR